MNVGKLRSSPAIVRPALALILLAHLALMQAVIGNDSHSHQDHQHPGAAAAAESQTTPALIDWKTYVSMFKKSYSSLTQQLIRQKLFMTKTIQVFLSVAKFRLNNLSYYMSINQFSDLTPKEERLLLSGVGGEYPADGDEADDIMDDAQVERVLRADLESQLRDESTPVSATHEVSRQMSARHRASNNGRLRQKRSTGESRGPKTFSRALSLSDLVRVPGKTDDDTGKLNIRWVVPSNNPEYTPVEQITFGAGEHDGHEEKVNEIPEDQIKKIERATSSWMSIPVSKALSESAKSTLSWIKSKSFNKERPSQQQQQQDLVKHNSSESTGETNNGVDKEQQNDPPAARDDIVIKDWRDSGCVAPPIEQGPCHSCYAVSSMAFLEWAFCMNQGRVLTPLSAQYMVSCGPQFKAESDTKIQLEFYGCSRGRSRQAMYFVKDYGAELEANMPYLGRETPCPIQPGTPLRSKGYIRPNVKQHVRMAATTSQLELALNVGPVIVNFREPIDFMAYGGGMVGRCFPQGGHAMLVVGHGVEDKKPYLIIKNSFGTNWGIRGYFKFDRKYTVDCIKDFILPRVSFPSKKSQARRVKAYLAEREQDSHESNLPNLDKIFDVGAGGLFS